MLKLKRTLAMLLAVIMMMSGMAFAEEEQVVVYDAPEVHVHEEPVAEVIEEPTEEPIEEPAEEPAEEPIEEPAEEPIEEPAEEPIEEPAEEPIEEPAEEPIEEPAEEPIEEPVEEPAEEPIEEPAEEPAEEPVEEPVEKPAAKQAKLVSRSSQCENHDWYGEFVEDELYMGCFNCDFKKLCEHEIEMTSSDREEIDVIDADANGHTMTYMPVEYYACEECGVEDIIRIYDEKSVSGEAHEFDHGECKWCGYEGSSCTHENYTVKDTNNVNISCVVLDAASHSEVYDVEEQRVCDDCGTRFEVISAQGVVGDAEAHEFDFEILPDAEGGLTFGPSACAKCGYESECEHAVSVAETYPHIIDESIKDNKDGTHSFKYVLTIEYQCGECDAHEYVDEETVYEVNAEKHVFIDGDCEVCEAKNECQHTNAVMEHHEEFYHYELDAAKETAQTHFFIICYGADYYICPDCKDSWYVEDAEPDHVNEAIAHSFDDEGECTICHYENKCAHENLVYDVNGYDLATDLSGYIVSKNHNIHTVKAYKYKSGKCPDCSQIIKEYEETVAEIKEEHKYTDDALCSVCGVIPECDHEWKDGVCTLCGIACEHEWAEGICSVCGIECKHEWAEGICDICGVACKHEWTEGVCDICGIACEHEWAEGICSVCGIACKHEWTEGICDICGVACKHEWTEGVCDICGIACEHEWTEGVCDICGIECKHEWAEGICSICGIECKHEWTEGVCDICGIACEHEWAEGICDICGIACKHEWSEGICSICGIECKHEWTEGVCDICGIACEHEWENGKCTVCGITCKHEWTDDKCSICGAACSEHKWENGECTICGTACEHEWTEGVCDICGVACKHEWAEGKCSICGIECKHEWTEGVCDICGIACEHEWENGKCIVCGITCKHEWVDDKCSICGAACSEHKWENGECTICGTACEHEWTEGKCSICGVACKHEWAEGKCSICGIECKHEWTEGICDICGIACEHEWTEGKCSICGVACKHEWAEGKCSICGIECKHEWSEGICSICGIACEHEWTEGKCSICGVACKHEWAEGKCSICGIACEHTDSFEFVETVLASGKAPDYVNNGNGSHTILNYLGYNLYVCSVCGVEDERYDGENGTLSKETEDCAFEDGQCVFCAAPEEPCEHEWKNGVCVHCAAPVCEATKIVVSGETVKVGYGLKGQLEFKVEPENANVLYSYATSDKKIVTVKDGEITGVKAGTATITVTAKNPSGTKVSAKIKVQVTAAPTSVSLQSNSPSGGYRLCVGESFDLKATVAKSGALYALTWSAEEKNKDKIELVSDGDTATVTGMEAGTVVVTVATQNNKKDTFTFKVVEVAEELTVNAEELTMGVGQTFEIKAGFDPADAGSYISYASDDETVATVDKNGKITAKGVGNAVITVSAFGVESKEIAVEVKKVPTSISLNLTSVTAGLPDKELILVASLEEDVYNKITFSSSSSSVAEVIDDGDDFSDTAVIKLKKAGTATITASTFNGKKATCKITVVKNAPKSFSVSPNPITLIEEDSQKISFSFNKNEGSWLIDMVPSDYAEYKDGYLTATQETDEPVELTFLYNDTLAAKKTVKLTVLPAITEIKIVPPENNAQVLSENSAIFAVGQTMTVGVERTTEHGATTHGDYSFKSSDSAVATVDKNGKITAKKAGTAKITVTSYNGKTDDFDVVVKAAPTKLSVSKSSITLGKGETFTVTATPSAGSAEVFTILKTPTTSNSKIATVAAVEGEEGVYEITAVGTKTGTATITLATHNGKKATVKVTVKKAPTFIKFDLDKDEIKLGAEQTATLKATLSSDSASQITWESSDPTIATVDQNGKITGVAKGEVTITASTYNYEDVEPATCIVEVSNAARIISISGAPELLSTSQSLPIQVELQDEFGKPVYGSFTVKSDRSSNASVSNVGTDGFTLKGVKAVSKVTTITVTAYNGVAESFTIAKVMDAPTSLYFHKEDGSKVSSVTIGAGEEITINMKHNKSAETPVSYKIATNPNSKYATAVGFEEADDQLTITGVAAGSTSVVVQSHNGKKATLKITVKKAPESITLDKTELKLGAEQTATLKATLSSGSASQITWESKDSTIATVDQNGKITAKSEGEVVITASTFNGHSAECKIYVSKAPTGIEIDRPGAVLSTGYMMPIGVQLMNGDEPVYGTFTVKSSRSNVSVKDVTEKGFKLKGEKKTTSDTIITVTAYNGVESKFTITDVMDAPTTLYFYKTNGAKVTTVTLGVGEELKINMKHNKSEDTPVTYSVSSKPNEKIATVEAFEGPIDQMTISGEAVGSTKIKVKSHNGKEATLNIKVKAEPTSIDLGKDVELFVGDTYTIPVSFSKDAYANVTWDEGANEGIMTLDKSSGKITAKQAGGLTITATTYNGLSDEIRLQVYAKPVKLVLDTTYEYYDDETKSIIVRAESFSDLQLNLNDMILRCIDKEELEGSHKKGSLTVSNLDSNEKKIATIGSDGKITVKKTGTEAKPTSIKFDVKSFNGVTLKNITIKFIKEAQ